MVDQKKDLFEIGSVEQPLENTEDNGDMCNIDSVEMVPVHLLQEDIVQKDLFKLPKDIFYSIEQKVPETKTAKKPF